MSENTFILGRVTLDEYISLSKYAYSKYTEQLKGYVPMCAFCACLHCLCSRVFVCVARSPCTALNKTLPVFSTRTNRGISQKISRR